MKTLLKQLIGLSLVLSVSCVLGADGNEGHGGDPLAVEFVSRGYSIFARVSKSGILLTAGQLKAFQKALKTTRIELVETPIIDPLGGSVTSVVFPDPKSPGNKYIKLHKPTWAKLLKNYVEVDRFVFHEYLRVIEVEDAHYEISNKLTAIPHEEPSVNTIEIEDLVSGEIVSASRAYPSQLKRRPMRLSSTSLIQAPYCVSTLGNSLEQETKTLAQESYFDKHLEWISQKKKEIQQNWNEAHPLLSINTGSSRTTASVLNDLPALANFEEKGKYGLPYTIYYYPHSFESEVTPPFYLLGAAYEQVNTADYCPTEIAFQKVSIREISITFQGNGQILKLSQPKLKGKSQTFYPYPNATVSEIIGTISKAKESYDEACNQWKAKVQKKLGDRFVFAHCGVPEEERVRAEDSKKGRTVTFSSTPQLYYQAD